METIHRGHPKDQYLPALSIDEMRTVFAGQARLLAVRVQCDLPCETGSLLRLAHAAVELAAVEENDGSTCKSVLPMCP